MDTPWIWLIGGLVVAALEIVVPGAFMLWIGIGAMVIGVLIAIFPDMPLAWEMVLFAVAMLGSLALGFVVQRRRKPSADPGVNHELADLVGRRCEVATDFTAGAGRIRVGDTTYSALCDAPVAAGSFVTIVAIEGGRLRVEPAG